MFTQKNIKKTGFKTQHRIQTSKLGSPVYILNFTYSEHLHRQELQSIYELKYKSYPVSATSITFNFVLMQTWDFALHVFKHIRNEL